MVCGKVEKDRGNDSWSGTDSEPINGLAYPISRVEQVHPDNVDHHSRFDHSQRCDREPINPCHDEKVQRGDTVGQHKEADGSPSPRQSLNGQCVLGKVGSQTRKYPADPKR